MLEQPERFLPLSLAQMGRFFTHYGVRALLILYMVDTKAFSDAKAFGVSALFCALVELGGIAGGIAADRYLSLRRAILLGGLVLCIGYSLLLVAPALFLALGLIILGGSLFSSNLSALLGQGYLEKDPRREKGFTYFYMMQNLGALSSALISGIIAERFGFQYGFAFAGIGIIAANLILLFYGKYLEGKKLQPIRGKPALLVTMGVFVLGLAYSALYFEAYVLPLLPFLIVFLSFISGYSLWKTKTLLKKDVLKLLLYLGMLVLFFAIEDQICSSLVVFTERNVDRLFFGFKIPSSFLLSVNPLVIIVFGAFATKWSRHVILPFLLTAAGIGALACCCLLKLPCSILGISSVVILISIAELMVGPKVTSAASEASAKGRPGFVMGMVSVAYSLAYLMGGHLSKLVTIEEQTTLNSYGIGFGAIALIALLGGALFSLMIKRISDDKHPLYQQK